MDLQRFAAQERTLPATPRRRLRARREGQVARSADLGGALGLFAAAAALTLLFPRVTTSFAAWSGGLFGTPPATDLTVAGVMALARSAAELCLISLGPILAAAALLAVGADLGQTGLLLSLRPLQPDLSRLNPVQGIARLFSRRALVELGRALLKAGALAVLVYAPVRELLLSLVSGGLALPAELALTLRTADGVVFRAAAVQLVAGGAEYAYRRWEVEQSIRMSPRELRDELRETDGDPALRARRRRRQRDMARRRMLAEVKRADVVLANPTHVAVALRYDPGQMAAPVVCAKGGDFMAERVKEIARAAGVLVVDNPPLARALYAGVRVGQSIPVPLYQAVAEVLAFVWRVQGRAAPAQRPAARPGARRRGGMAGGSKR